MGLNNTGSGSLDEGKKGKRELLAEENKNSGQGEERKEKQREPGRRHPEALGDQGM